MKNLITRLKHSWYFFNRGYSIKGAWKMSEWTFTK